MSSELNLRHFLSLEVRSYLGRLFLQRCPKMNSQRRLLNLGCGNIRPPGWVNADFFVFTKKDRPTLMLDLRFPLPSPHDYWDGVFCEHTLEHLNPRHAQALLSEILRVLQPGCFLRISVPDLEKYINFYNGQPNHDRFASKWSSPGLAIRSLTQDHYHLSVWDAPLLTDALIDAGFTNVLRTEYMQGRDAKLLIDQSERSYESLYMEAQKPL